MSVPPATPQTLSIPSQCYQAPPCPTFDPPTLLALAKTWHDVLAASDVGPKYATERLLHVTRIVTATGGRLDDAAVQVAVGKLRDKGWSARTLNKHVGAMKQMTKWMAARSRGYLPYDPLAEVPYHNVRRDRRRLRTSFSEGQWLALFRATLASPYNYRGICGADRAELYHAAACTGLREGTLAVLEVGQFDLAGPVAIVTARAEQLKDAEDLAVPIQADSAARLRSYFRGKMPGARAFRAPAHSYDFVRMLQVDLADAGVTYCRKVALANGRVKRVDVLDFHSLRHTFGTRCASAGIPLTTTQRMMGHSTPELTANVYSHVMGPDLVEAMRRLPALPGVAAAAAG